MSRSGNRRAVVIGMDGTPFSFLEKEIGAGNLPNMARLAAKSKLSRMETEIPTISSVAWASFMTGKNPGEHGIFGFTDRKPGTYDLYFPNYSNLRSEPFWDKLSRDGKRCCVINVPSTYPAKPLNGFLVSGFVAPNLERASYPRETFDYLQSSGYRIDVDASKARDSLDALLEDLHAVLEKRREAMHHFWRQEDWDLFVCVFTGTDRLHHFLWSHYEEGHPTYRSEFLRYYQRLDEIVGEFVEELPEDLPLFMLSDHGFCSIRNEVYVNVLLRDRGLLAYAKEQPLMLSDIDPLKTRAYCMDPGRIYLNLKGREPDGTVLPGEAAGLLDEIEAMFLELKDPDSGEPVSERVVRREDIYAGDQAMLGPDMVIVPRDGFDLKGTMSQQRLTGRGLNLGMHTRDDAMVLAEPRFNDVEHWHIRDLAPRILRAIEE